MKYEVMAPAGSRESLMAAIKAGADSVYFGVEALNMRAHSANTFTLEDIAEVVRICDEAGVRTYLTVNVVIYGEDLEMMRKICDAAKAAKVSAVIAADVAVLSYCRSIDQVVHLSTQMNISNVESLRFYAMFADVVVLARELSMDQVQKIREAIVDENICGPSGNLIRIEMFCHGAFCMAVSGKCYLSLHNQGPSANRGQCTQQCRRKYIVSEKGTGMELEIDNEYIMSAKDLKTIAFVPRMMEAGVEIFKIEGRARAAEYVYTTVKCYKEAIEAAQNGTFTDEKVEDWNNRLATVFNRGFWDGYYQGQKLGEWSNSHGSIATETKAYVAKGQKYFAKLGVAEFLVEAGEIRKGDRLLITGPTTGVIYLTAESIHGDNGPIEVATKGMAVAIPVSEKVRPSDKLYKIIAR